MSSGERVWLEHTGGCPECGGPVDIVQATFDNLPAPKPGRCVYSKWRRKGVFEDAGICTGKRAKRTWKASTLYGPKLPVDPLSPLARMKLPRVPR